MRCRFMFSTVQASDWWSIKTETDSLAYSSMRSCLQVSLRALLEWVGYLHITPMLTLQDWSGFQGPETLIPWISEALSTACFALIYTLQYSRVSICWTVYCVLLVSSLYECCWIMQGLKQKWQKNKDLFEYVRKLLFCYQFVQSNLFYITTKATPVKLRLLMSRHVWDEIISWV